MSKQIALSAYGTMHEVWPQIDNVTMKKYIEDVTGVGVEPEWLDEFQKAFGVSDPEQLAAIKLFVEITTIREMTFYGVNGIEEWKILSKVERLLDESGEFRELPPLDVLRVWISKSVEEARQLKDPLKVRALLVKKIEEREGR